MAIACVLRSGIRCLLVVVCASVLAVEALPERIAPDDPRISLQGAWSEDYQAAWTGTGVRFRTTAEAVNLLIADHAAGGVHPQGGNRNNYLAIQIDDGEAVTISLERDRERYPVPGLDGQLHTVTVFKRTEALFGPWTFKGLELPDSTSLVQPPPPAERRIQVIGDSISAGYGNEADGPKTRFRHSTENGWMTYWAIAARELGADVRCAASSGMGVLRDRQNNTEHQLPQIWRFALPDPKRQAPERSGVDWRPTLAVINLGTNDVAQGSPEAEPFMTAYRGLITDIRSDAPGCRVFVVFGPMLDPKRHESHAAIKDYLEQLAAEDEGVWLVELHNPFGIDGAGTHWHPNVRANQAMAEQLLAAIRAADEG